MIAMEGSEGDLVNQDSGGGFLLLHGANGPDGSPLTLLLGKGVIAARGDEAQAHAASIQCEELRLDGFAVLPAFAEPHAHLDKALLARRVKDSSQSLSGALEAMQAIYGGMSAEDVLQRAGSAVRSALASGLTAIRSHVDVNKTIGTRSLRALLALRDGIRDTIQLQIGAHSLMQLTGAEGRAGRQLLTQALELGIDVVGGAPWRDPAPEKAVALLCAAAREAGRQVDLHLDETTDPGVLVLRHFITEVERSGLGGRATASHCVSLGQQEPDVARKLAGDLAAAGIGLVTLPQTNLYLQGRKCLTRVPRALAPARLLLEHGVTVAAGGDNWRDPFNPLARIDPLETASLAVAASHLSPAQALAAVSTSARSVMGLPPAGLRTGDVADLVAVRAPDSSQAIASGTQERVTVKAGRVVARTRLQRWSELDGLRTPEQGDIRQGHAPDRRE